MQHKPTIRRALFVPYPELYRVLDAGEDLIVSTHQPEHQKGQPATKSFPRVLQAKQRVAEAEEGLAQRMHLDMGLEQALDFEGLSLQQKTKLGAVVRRNGRLHRWRASKGAGSAAQPSNGEEDTEAEGADEDSDGEFPVEPVKLLEPEEAHGSSRAPKRSNSMVLPPAARRRPSALLAGVDPKSLAANSMEEELLAEQVRAHKQRYVKWISKAASSAFSTDVRSPSTEEEKRMEAEAYRVMKAVTDDLRTWVRESLEPPLDFEEAQCILDARPDRAIANVDIEDVDVTGLDVLLNASKPSLMEGKPTVRMNVVNETNATDALVSSLQRNVGKMPSSLGLDKRMSSAKSAGIKHTGLPRPVTSAAKKLEAREKGFTFGTKPKAHKVQYGRWYVPPEQWEDFMKHKGVDADQRKIEEAKNRKFGGLMQKKLDEIEAKRKAEVVATEAAERRQRKREEARAKAAKALEKAVAAAASTTIDTTSTSTLPVSGVTKGAPEGGRADAAVGGSAGKRAPLAAS